MSEKYNITIRFVRGWQNVDDGVIIGWEAENIGFGEMTICGTGKQITCESECMGQEFCEAVLRALASSWTLTE